MKPISFYLFYCKFNPLIHSQTLIFASLFCSRLVNYCYLCAHQLLVLTAGICIIVPDSLYVYNHSYVYECILSHLHASVCYPIGKVEFVLRYKTRNEADLSLRFSFPCEMFLYLDGEFSNSVVTISYLQLLKPRLMLLLFWILFCVLNGAYTGLNVPKN